MTLLAGKIAKAFTVHKDLSITDSPNNILHDDRITSTTIAYPDFNKFTFGFFEL